MCVVMGMEDPMKMFEDDNMPKDLVEGESKFIMKKKRLELTQTR